MNDNNENGKLDRVLVGEADLKRVILTSVAALFTAVIVTGAGGIWSVNNKLKDIEAWQEKHDAHYQHGIEQVVDLGQRVLKLEEFANRGDRYTSRDAKEDGAKMDARVRMLENTSIRIEAKLDVILDKLGVVKQSLGAPHP